MRRSETNELKQKLKRLGLFMLIVFLPIMVVAFLMWYCGVPEWLNILVLVVILFVLYFLYLWICSKIDKKKSERLNKKKDPFS